MKQTEHYGLSQWERTDRILMEDFNDDNRKLDRAIAAVSLGKVGRLEYIKRVYEGGGASFGGMAFMFFEEDLGSWNDWDWVGLLFQFPQGEEGTGQKKLTVGLKDGDVFQKFTGLGQPGILVLFLPGHDRDSQTRGFLLADRLIPFQFEGAFSEFKQWSCVPENIGDGVRPVTPNVVLFGGS